MEITGPSLKKAVEAIKKGEVFVCPTDTVYGLICDARNKEAVDRLYKIKRRPRSKPIPVFVSDIEMAKKIANINSEQEKFLKKIWPGPVTAVLEKKNGGGTIGIRIPNHEFVLDLVKYLGPLAETSANISDKPASVKISEVLAQFGGEGYQPDLIIDGGDLPPSKPSKVIDLRVLPPKILRA